jgi:hypothetical protein
MISSFRPQPKVHSHRRRTAEFRAFQDRSADRETVRKGQVCGGSSQERTVLPDRQGRYREMLRDRERREGAEARHAVGFGTVRLANGYGTGS